MFSRKTNLNLEFHDFLTLLQLQVLFVSFVIDSFFVKKIWLLQKFVKTWRVHVGSTFKKNGGTYVLVLSLYVKDFKYLLNVDI